LFKKALYGTIYSTFSIILKNLVTLLLALLKRCREVLLEDLENDHQGANGTATTVTPTQTTLIKSARQSYDNAYFYILFVMFFYSFLALTLFRSFVHSDKTKKDPYEEFMGLKNTV
uniref:Uncharacterized protein n=1 Tax=Pygocentrus nattereri TaxID=42514 RepID=A0A3B4EM27_PYGNA